MSELPRGTVTFLFTDIEGSTKLLHELGAERYAEELASHRVVLREAFARHEGVEVDTQGDAFFVVFATAPSALAAASEAQRALDIPVRMGLDTGTPLVTEEGYVGADVHRAARIAAAGHGRQILVSASTAALVGANAGLEDLGLHRLKDIAEPVRLYQHGAGAFPPLRTLNRTNLPAPPHALVGREDALAELLRLVVDDGARLVTILGPGGIGKTRIVLAAASELVDGFRGGAWFVDLSALRSPELVPTAIESALGATVRAADHIGDSELLLVLDNFEQVVEAAPSVGELLDRCPKLRVLATSREPLELRAERRYPLQPLAPAAAAQLFQQRAQDLDPAFDAPPEQLGAICTALDNLPLALELGAARTTLFSPSQLLDRLEERLPLLASRARDLPERQRTLRAAIEWSYDLLEPDERQLLVQLAVFSGGFTLDAVEAVCGAGADVLESLVEKSLVLRKGERFAMLETIREFAGALFAELPDAGAITTRHAEHYWQLARLSESDLTGVRQSQTAATLAADYDNIRQALATAEDTAPQELLGVAAALVVFWYVRSLFAEGKDWLDRALSAATGDAAPRTRARALWGLAMMSLLVGDLGDVQGPLDESIALATAHEDESVEARGYSLLGLLALFTDDLAASRDLFEKAEALARHAGDAWCLADALGTLASIYPLHGDVEAAEVAGREGLEMARGNLDEHGIRMSLFGLALAASRRGDAALVETRAHEGLDVSRSLGDLWFSSYFLWLLADAALALGDAEAALAHANESVELAERIGVPLLSICGLDVRARIALQQGDHEAALRDAEAAVAVAQLPGVFSSYASAAFATRGLVAARLGDSDAARELLSRAEELAAGVGDVIAEERARAALASLD